MGMPELTADMGMFADVHPQRVATFSTLRMFEQYFDHMTKRHGIDGATAAIIISCPEEKPRTEMLKRYLQARNHDNLDKSDQDRILSASIVGVGMWYQYMSNSMGLNEPKMNARKDIASEAGSSPKKFIMIAIHRLFEKYFNFVTETYGTDGATAAILILCPEEDARKRMWTNYQTARDNADSDLSDEEKIITASVTGVGDWYGYMTDYMGLNETTTGGG